MFKVQVTRFSLPYYVAALMEHNMGAQNGLKKAMSLSRSHFWAFAPKIIGRLISYILDTFLEIKKKAIPANHVT